MLRQQQLLSSSNCSLLSSISGRYREQQIVIDVFQLVGPSSVHDTLTLLSDLDCLANPPCSLVWLTGDDLGLVPVNDVIFLVDVICDCRFVLFWSWLFPGTSGIFTPFLCFNFLLTFLHTDSKTASCLSNVDFVAVFTQNSVNTFCCFVQVYFILWMDQQISTTTT